MFEVPSAKRLKREDLFDTTDTQGQLQHSEDYYNDGIRENSAADAVPDYGFEYSFVNHPANSTASETPANPAPEQTFQFNLFHPSSKPPLSKPVQNPTTKQDSTTQSPESSNTAIDQTTNNPTPQLISIRSPSPSPPPSNTQAFQTPRPQSHYFTASLPPAKLSALRKSYETSAISGTTILSTLRTTPWPGTSLPWRVLHLPAHAKQSVIIIGNDAIASDTAKHSKSATTTTAADHIPKSTPKAIADNSSRRRPRPSKKRRTLTREKSRLRQRIVDETKSKEEHEREKRARKNRERKVKRRAKERREKALKKGVEGGSGESEGGSGIEGES